MRKKYWVLGPLAVLALAFPFVLSCNHLDPQSITDSFSPHLADSANRVERGRYLVSTMGCDDCHSPKKMGPHGPEIDSSRRLSGYPAGRPLPDVALAAVGNWVLFAGDLTAAVGPWGVSFSANLTSDATGIGNWTEAQFLRCVREGKWKGLDGRSLLPPMPWQNVAKLTDRDIRSIFAYLKTTKPVANNVPQPIPVAELRSAKK